MIIFGLENTVFPLLTDIISALVVCIADALVGVVISPVWVYSSWQIRLVVIGISIIACWVLLNIGAVITGNFGISSIITGLIVGLLFVVSMWIGITITKKRRII